MNSRLGAQLSSASGNFFPPELKLGPRKHGSVEGIVPCDSAEFSFDFGLWELVSLPVGDENLEFRHTEKLLEERA